MKHASMLEVLEEQARIDRVLSSRGAQTRLESFLEAASSTAFGFAISFGVWQSIAGPIFGYHVTLVDNFWLTTIFTVVSLVRQYVFRRFFNANIHKAIHQFVLNLGRK
jgi:hypothetical protein